MSSSPTKKNRLRDVLTGSDFLVQPSNDLLEAAVSNTVTQTFDRDHTIYEVGDIAEQFFLVIDGQVELTRKLSGDQKAFCRMKQGELFGLLSTVTSSARRSQAQVASKEATVACVHYEKLVNSLEEKTDLRLFMEGLIKHLGKRIDRSSDVIETLV